MDRITYPSIHTWQMENFIIRLYPRMKLPGNMWLEVWSAANPIPARRQKRLFDDTKEAEKVIICKHILPFLKTP